MKIHLIMAHKMSFSWNVLKSEWVQVGIFGLYNTRQIKTKSGKHLQLSGCELKFWYIISVSAKIS